MQAWALPDGQLPVYLLELPASVGTVLVADTERATLYRFDNGPDGVRYVDERYMSIGQYGVDKRRPWDRRTPLGVYFITERLDTTRLHERYGPVAFPLDYPNIWDRLNRRGGAAARYRRLPCRAERRDTGAGAGTATHPDTRHYREGGALGRRGRHCGPAR